MKNYAVEDSRVAFAGDLSTVRVDRVRMPDGDVAEREIVEHPDAVAVVPVDADGNVVLLRQYRHALGEHVLEIPAGKLDVDGEAPLRAARRELIEEIGMDAGDIAELVRFHNSSGWSTESTTVYLATDLREADVPEDFTANAEEAHMEVLRMPLTEAVDRTQRGEITDAKTLIGLLLAGARLGQP